MKVTGMSYQGRDAADYVGPDLRIIRPVPD